MARPLVVRVGDLLRDPGSRRSFDVEVDLDGLATTSAQVSDGVPIAVIGNVEGMAGGVVASGNIIGEWSAECRRCLEPVTATFDIAFREICQREPVDEDVYEIDGDLLDVEPIVRELILADLPLAPLCRDDCAGPEPERFPATVEQDPDPDEEPPADPRWAALGELTFDE